jgi:hypothetical protein
VVALLLGCIQALRFGLCSAAAGFDAAPHATRIYNAKDHARCEEMRDKRQEGESLVNA